MLDGIFADLPYGTTACSWDEIIPFNEHITINGKVIYKNEWLNFERFSTYQQFMEAQLEWDATAKPGLWQHYKRLIKERGAVVLTGSQPFTSKLVMSNLEWFKYEWIWEKSKASDFINANHRPMKKHENVIVFSSGNAAPGCDDSMIYNPQGLVIDDNIRTRKGTLGISRDRESQQGLYISLGSNYPTSLVKASNESNAQHPTQKPVALFAYLIRTYTNAGDIIMDNTMGSGTTLVAAQNEGRRAIGIDISEDYCKIAVERLRQLTFFSIPDAPKPEPKQASLF